MVNVKLRYLPVCWNLEDALVVNEGRPDKGHRIIKYIAYTLRKVVKEKKLRIVALRKIK